MLAKLFIHKHCQRFLPEEDTIIMLVADFSLVVFEFTQKTAD